jgi:primosomal protein N'
MEYFRHLQELLKKEKAADQQAFKAMTEHMPVNDRRANGLSWYPVAIRDTEIGTGDYLSVEVERTTHHDIIHQLRFGMTAALFSNHNAKNDRVEGTITYVGANRLKISLRVDELPDWSRNGKLGVDAVFDQNSYDEMEFALKLASLREKEENHLVQVLTGKKTPSLNNEVFVPLPGTLNAMQQLAVQKIIQANEVAIVHGPPGTGKTTTLVQAIVTIVSQTQNQVLVVAPSNAAVDLLSEKLSNVGLNVVRVGNPARVSEQQMSLTLDSKMAAHPDTREIKRLKKQASEYKNMAHKYKRSFGYAEREQRKALFNEAKNIGKEAERIEKYITDDILGKANIVTATW